MILSKTLLRNNLMLRRIWGTRTTRLSDSCLFVAQGEWRKKVAGSRSWSSKNEEMSFYHLASRLKITLESDKSAFDVDLPPNILLRNLLWSTSKHDVYLMQKYRF